MLFVAALSTLLASAALTSATPVSLAKRNETVQGPTPDLANVMTFTPPTPPTLDWLYRAYVLCPLDLLDGEVGPLGQRKAIPIIGGNVTLNDGTVGYLRNLGADEGLVDAQTGLFTADTRYHAVLPVANGYNGTGASNETDLFFQTSGPKQADGSLHLRIKIETSSKPYYHFNNLVVNGVLNNLGRDENGTSTLRIDAYHMSGEWTNTTFLTD
ncbi:hypothetical protein JCM8547_008094 [Rhodosporidiobolus lusitaniae]